MCHCFSKSNARWLTHTAINLDLNAINLDLNADTIFPVRIYLKRWKDPDEAGARHNEVKEELESAKCYSIEFSGKLCSDTAEGRCTIEKRNVLLEPEPTTEQVISCLGVPVLSTQKPETKGPTTRSKFRRAATVLPESFRTPTANLHRTSLGPTCQVSLVGLGL